jgi:hypothetical protein
LVVGPVFVGDAGEIGDGVAGETAIIKASAALLLGLLSWRALGLDTAVLVYPKW